MKENRNKLYLICFPAKSHQEVIWFDVSMQKPFRMYIFYSHNLQEQALNISRHWNACFPFSTMIFSSLKAMEEIFNLSYFNTTTNNDQ